MGGAYLTALLFSVFRLFSLFIFNREKRRAFRRRFAHPESFSFIPRTIVANYWFTKKNAQLLQDRKTPYHLTSYYRPIVIAMFDNLMAMGGLRDRLNLITLAYSLCRELNFPFRIHFVEPFALTYFLLPNKYDWRIAPEDICGYF